MNKKMTRKEQIKQAAREYATHLTDTGEMDYHGHFEKAIKCNADEYRVFIAGAEWADNNPKCYRYWEDGIMQ